MSEEVSRVIPADGRYRIILSALRDDGRLYAQPLAERLGVTGETVRKDLIHLESLGRLRRVHGGAIPPESVSYEVDVGARLEFLREKERIATAALAYLPRSGSILIDAGSTTERFSARMPADRDLVVYTNALPIATTLVTRRRLSVYVLGGRLRETTIANVGSITERMLSEVNVEVAFLGTNAISADRGLTTPDPAEASVKRGMVAASQRRVLLCDHSKFGSVVGAQHAVLSEIDVLITDRAPGPDLADALAEASVTTEVV